MTKMTLDLCAKCSDCFSATLTIGGKQYDLDGYVPEGLGIGGDDYISFEVDLETGQILNWVKPTQASLDKVVESGEEI